MRKSRTTDGMGGWSETESTLLTVWAQVLTPRSKTGVVAQQDAEIRTHEIAIRYSALPAINDIVKHLGDRLEVKGVRYDAKKAVDIPRLRTGGGIDDHYPRAGNGRS